MCCGYTKFKAHCLRTRIFFFFFNISFLLVLFVRRQPSSSLIEPHSQSIEFQKCERRSECLLCACRCRLNSLAAVVAHYARFHSWQILSVGLSDNATVLECEPPTRNCVNKNKNVHSILYIFLAWHWLYTHTHTMFSQYLWPTKPDTRIRRETLFRIFHSIFCINF